MNYIIRLLRRLGVLILPKHLCDSEQPINYGIYLSLCLRYERMLLSFALNVSMNYCVGTGGGQNNKNT